MEKIKTDAIWLKRQGSLAVAARLAALSPEQQKHFWEEQTRLLRERKQARHNEALLDGPHHLPPLV